MLYMCNATNDYYAGGGGQFSSDFHKCPGYMHLSHKN